MTTSPTIANTAATNVRPFIIITVWIGTHARTRTHTRKHVHTTTQSRRENVDDTHVWVCERVSVWTVAANTAMCICDENEINSETEKSVSKTNSGCRGRTQQHQQSLTGAGICWAAV